MINMKPLLLPCLVGLAGLISLCSNATSHAAQATPVPPCDDTQPANKIALASIPNYRLKLFKHYCYQDSSGSYDLLLLEKQDLKSGDEILSSEIEAQLFKRVVGAGANAGALKQWGIKDSADANEVGVNFRSKLVELGDIDGDGLIEPILIYKFTDANQDNSDPAYQGRLKIVMFYKGTKVAIRAKTGVLDGERKTTASASFFELPGKVQKHLVDKMRQMYEQRIFGFDNGNAFGPLKEAK